jgi:hypothetical protein
MSPANSVARTRLTRPVLICAIQSIGLATLKVGRNLFGSVEFISPYCLS